MSTQTDLADRYGARSPRRRWALLAACVVLAAVFLGWLAWVIWDQSNPEVESHLVTYEVVDEHTATAAVQVNLDDPDVHAVCTLRAYAEDHTVVGELTFTPTVSGRTERTVRTERRATSVESVGCTAPGQNRPR